MSKRSARTKKPVRISLDIGGVLSKNPDIWLPIVRALNASPEVEVHIITDMHKPEQTRAMLDMNGFDFVPPERVHNSDFTTYGEGCKAVLLKKLKVDIHVDDFPAYVAEGAPVRLLQMPDLRRTYYDDKWKTDGSEGNFGRRKKT